MYSCCYCWSFMDIFYPPKPVSETNPSFRNISTSYFYNYLMIQTCPAENSKPKYWTYGKNIITIRFWTLSSSVELAICGRNFDFQTWHGTIITPNEIILWKAVTISILVEVWTLYGQPLWVGAFWTGIVHGRHQWVGPCFCFTYRPLG